MAMTWEAIFEQWPWFAAAAGVLVIVVGLLILLKPKSKRQRNTTSSAADSKEWVLTGRIDFIDPHSAGELVLSIAYQ
jgi:cytochrome c biogenesis protein CcdA